MAEPRRRNSQRHAGTDHLSRMLRSRIAALR